MLKFNEPICENLEQTINFYCTKETESFKCSEYFYKITQLTEKLGLNVECSYDFVQNYILGKRYSKKFIYLYFDIVDKNGDGVYSKNDESDALGFSICIVSIDRKNRFEFYSWQDDDDWIDSLEWNIKELEKMVQSGTRIIDTYPRQK